MSQGESVLSCEPSISAEVLTASLGNTLLVLFVGVEGLLSLREKMSQCSQLD